MDEGPTTVLHVDDEPGLCDLAATFLERENPTMSVLTAQSASAGMATLSDEVDCVVSDYDMPVTNGLDFFEDVRTEYPDLPFILYTGRGSEEIAAEALSAGVTDYLQKETGSEQYAVLANRIENAVAQYRTERELERERERFRGLIEHATDIITVLDGNGVIQYESPSVEHVLGRDPGDLIGELVFEYIHPDDREDAVSTFAEALAEPGLVTDGLELRFRHADGSWRWIEAVGSNQRDTSVGGYVINSRDIHERKRQERRFGRLIENASDAILVIDDTRTIRYASPAVDRVMEYDSETLEGIDALTRVHPDDRNRVAAELERGARTPGYATAITYRARTDDGEWGWMEAHGRSLVDEPEVGGIVVSVRDVTARIERERELERQNRRLDRFAAVLSHDLRSPLSVARGAFDLYRETGDAALADRVVDAHERMDRIVDDVLAMARDGDTVTDPRTVSLARVAEAAWGSVETGDAVLRVESTARIQADESRLRRALENLFRNSVEHGSTGNRAKSGNRHERVDGPRTDGLTVRVGTVESGSDESASATGSDDARVEGLYVADDGDGIPESVRDRLFDSGITTGVDGTGFGLAIVSEVVAAHGWRVEADESDGGGARFRITGVGVPPDRPADE